MEGIFTRLFQFFHVGGCSAGLHYVCTVHGRKKHRAASKQTSTLVYLSWPLGGPPRMGAASAAYCALSAGSKPIEEVPKVIPAWQDGALHPKYGTLVPQHGFSPLVSPVALTAPRRRRRGGMREWDGRLVSPRHRRKWPRPPHFLLAATLFAVLLLCLPLSWHHANASAALAPAPSLLAPPSEGLRLARDLIVVACHAVYTAEDHGHAALQRETSWFLEPFRAGCTLH